MQPQKVIEADVSKESRSLIAALVPQMSHSLSLLPLNTVIAVNFPAEFYREGN